MSPPSGEVCTPITSESNPSTVSTNPVNNAHHQYSLRLARPSNFAYFLKARRIAPLKLIP